MGLFTSVLHLRDVEHDRLIPALDNILQQAGFVRDPLGTVPAGGPDIAGCDDEEAAGPCYVASPLSGRWLTLIETSWPASDALNLSEISRRLSSVLSCHALALYVHDDDVFFYNLDYQGEPLDRYNSCPQYFIRNRLSEVDIEHQRHGPEPFATLLPPGRTLDEIRSLLSRGWWHAHDTGELDHDGLTLHDDDGYVFESERMSAFGTLLQLHGGAGSYPYAAWGAAHTTIDWLSFVSIRYLPADRASGEK